MFPVIEELKEIAKKYTEKYGKLKKIESLVETGFLKFIPKDSFGRKYYINTQGDFVTPSTEERFRPFKTQKHRGKDGND